MFPGFLEDIPKTLGGMRRMEDGRFHSCCDQTLTRLSTTASDGFATSTFFL